MKDETAHKLDNPWNENQQPNSGAADGCNQHGTGCHVFDPFDSWIIVVCDQVSNIFNRGIEQLCRPDKTNQNDQ